MGAVRLGIRRPSHIPSRGAGGVSLCPVLDQPNLRNLIPDVFQHLRRGSLLLLRISPVEQTGDVELVQGVVLGDVEQDSVAGTAHALIVAGQVALGDTAHAPASSTVKRLNNSRDVSRG